MEFKVKQVQDTREKMQLRHIKGLDIVTNEVNRIMPNSLSGEQMSAMYNEDDEERTDEQIKKDLEDVDDVFAANVWSAGLSKLAGGPSGVPEQEQVVQKENKFEDPPEEEWLNTSSEDEKDQHHDQDFDISQDLSI